MSHSSFTIALVGSPHSLGTVEIVSLHPLPAALATPGPSFSETALLTVPLLVAHFLGKI